jgi:hypothetical protein
MENYKITLTSGIGMASTASTSEVKKYLENNEQARIAFQKNPIDELDKVVKGAAESKPAYYNDKWIYRWVAIALGVALLVASVGAIILSVIDKTVPDILVAVASGTVGALAGLFAPRGQSA